MNNFLDEFKEDNKQETINKKPLKKGIKTVENDITIDNTYLKKRKQKRLIVGLISFLSMVVIIIIITLSNLVTVPEFTNNLSSIATKWATSNKIELTINEEYNNDYASDVIISQSISSGQKIFKKSKMTINVSKGKNPDEIIMIPDFNSMTASEIKTWISNNGLTNTTITEQTSEAVEKGKIISYSFESVLVDEKTFKRSDTLNIIVSKGSSSLTMSDLTNKSKDDVSKWCTENSINCTFKEKLSSTVDSGKIISQSLKSGEKITTKTNLVFYVSIGSGITVPNYSKYSKDEAESVNDKFKVTIKEYYSMTVNYGSLISQSVKSGTKKQETDNAITLIYSLGKPYFSSLVGTSESELAKVFYEYNQKGVEFNYTIKYVNSSEEKGKIVWTSKSNEFVSMKEEIEIHVSNGISEQ